MFFLVAAFVVFFDLVQPAYGNLMTAKGTLAGEQALLQNEASTTAQVNAIISTYSSESADLQSVGQILPSGENIAGAAAQVYGLASADNIGIQMMSMSVSAPTQGAARTVGGAAGLAAGLAVRPTGTIALSLTASGNYESFRNFLSGLETNTRIFDVKQLSIQPAITMVGNQKATDFFNFQLTVDTYYQAN